MTPAAILVVILAAALVIARLFSRDRVIDRQVRRGPATRLADLADGAVAAARGRVRGVPGEPALAAPLSRRPCLYYQLEVQAFDPASLLWVTVHAEARGRAILLDDGSASARIEPGGWRISVDRAAGSRRPRGCTASR